jgi:YjbE family integral membrane protein
MDVIVKNFADLFTVTGAVVLMNIILIDIVMSGDNAILIGMATRKLEGKERKKAIFFGILLATVLRIIFAFFAVQMLRIVGIKLAGGVLLLYVVWKFYRELRSSEKAEHHMETKKDGLMAAVWTIIIADVSMSLDNVLAVAGAAHDNVAALGIGLIVSIILMAFASNLIAKYLDRFPQIQWLGLLVILFIAVEMILSGSVDIDKKWLHVNIMPFLLFVLGAVFLVLHSKYIRPANEQKIQAFLQSHALSVLASIVFFLLGMLMFGDSAIAYVQSHDTLYYCLAFILFFSLLELLSLAKV